MNVEEVIRTAIKMEEDGYQFYKKAEGCTASKVGKEMYAFLAEYEMHHKKLLEGLLNKTLPDAKELDIPLPKERLKSVFGDITKNVCERVPSTNDDLDALTFAMTKETESFKMYDEAAKGSADPKVGAVFARMAKEEESHYEILQDTRYYLEQFANWSIWEEGGPIEGG